MKRIKLTIAYDGTAYSGWQIQPNAPTIEGEVQAALQKVLKQEITLTGASRTDAGVHALGNVAVFDTECCIPAEKVSYAVNSYLPDDIRVMRSEEVPMNFHPRYDCHTKRYEYLVSQDTFCSPLQQRYVHHHHRKLCLEAMQKAANGLVGTHDFSSFCAAGAQVDSKVRTITCCEVYKSADGLVVIGVEGDGFLYNMVRIIAGTLLRVGEGLMKPEDIPAILAAMDRSKAGPTAPAKGLRLCGISYGEADAIRFGQTVR